VLGEIRGLQRLKREISQELESLQIEVRELEDKQLKKEDENGRSE
jgi:hypothetical protein